MRICTLKNGTRDGELAVVHPDGNHFARARAIAPTLQAALDDWDRVLPELSAMSAALASGAIPGEPLDLERVMAPLPRAYEWVDGSAYINHIVLVRKARGAELPKTLLTDPLVYQGGSSDMLGCREPIDLVNQDWGLDFEAEVGVILGDVPRGTTAADAAKYIRLF